MNSILQHSQSGRVWSHGCAGMALREGSSIGYCGRGRFLTAVDRTGSVRHGEYYLTALAAFGTDLMTATRWRCSPWRSPELGRRLSQARIETLLRHAGRQPEHLHDRRHDPSRVDI